MLDAVEQNSKLYTREARLPPVNGTRKSRVISYVTVTNEKPPRTRFLGTLSVRCDPPEQTADDQD
jgi:hypothetical protein